MQTVNSNPNLPVVDISGFHAKSDPDEQFIVLDPKSQEEDDRLKALLNVDELIRAMAKKIKKHERRTLGPLHQLTPAAATESGHIVAVSVLLTFPSHGANDTRWLAFAVEPDDYEELESKVWGWFSERGFVRPSKN
jgi:hypothetical protein